MAEPTLESRKPTPRVNPFKTLIDGMDTGAGLPVVDIEGFTRLAKHLIALKPNSNAGSESLRSNLLPETNLEAAYVRYALLNLALTQGELSEWTHGELDSVVFVAAATFDLKPLEHPAQSLLTELRKLSGAPNVFGQSLLPSAF